MGKPLCRQSGLYQWDATVAGYKDSMRQAVLITVFCDTRREAVDAACHEVSRLGYANCTVDHITRIRG
ncbi:hypothetical protein M2194_005027 [Bradyrhizobium elkanii]|nr:hypothetical protein [Bradyrhizobium elkanii]